ncbi:galactose-1-phosphate uridylyltransferase [Rubinisphaera margarita]|uniref:galactose-1-phosphate uridylyltransferase n=1 Tax=Rubinisphaera margarita TaxID=2909586 RepID=UPI001EE972C6|nr:hypothetical protein [Rubinisphaera margarita]
MESAHFAGEHHEVRYDPVHDWPVIFAPPRARRPVSLSQTADAKAGSTNPFAEFNEHLTTDESFALRNDDSKPNGPGWQVRVIPNKYPVLTPEASPEEDCQRLAAGLHEVIIEHPQPLTDIAECSDKEFSQIFLSYRERLKALAEHPDVVHATVFKNQGRNAGASQPHVHSQLMATRFVPPHVNRELQYAERYRAHTGRTPLQDLLEAELQANERIVQHTEHCTLLCPYVSRFAFEMLIIPHGERAHFHQTSEEMLEDVAGMMRQALLRLRCVTGSRDFNFVLHTAPFAAADECGFRWHWEIYPRLAGIAGWELGQGSYVNPVYPEFAAQQLAGA